jgi:hypothetical protein
MKYRTELATTAKVDILVLYVRHTARDELEP